jgi:O-antigen/teichoic acid export membrane protein
MEMFDKTVIRNTIVKLATTALIFIVVRTREDVENYALIMALGYLVSQLALWPYLRKYITFSKIKWENVKKHILPNLTMFLPVIAVSIYKVMDKIMLGMMSTKAVVGYYENAEKIINVPIAVVTALGTVMLPRVTALVSENKDQEVSKFRDTAIMIVTAFTVAACFGIIGVANTLSVWMWGEDFIVSGTVMKYLASTLVFLGIGNVIRTQFLIPYKYDRIYVISAFLGAIVNVIVNALLIPPYGAVGAAIGTICAEASVCFYQLFMVRKSLPLLKYGRDTVLFCIAGLVMLLVISILPQFESKLLSLIEMVLIGACAYMLIVGPFIFKKAVAHFKR